MRVVGHDPRDTNSQVLDPAYRVDFWDGDGASDSYRFTDVKDVTEVLDWAQKNANGREISLCVEDRELDRLTLIRVFGVEPV